MLTVIPDLSVIQPDGSKAMVVVESSCGGPPFHDAFEELGSNVAVAVAQKFAAANGVSPAYLNGNKIGPYPVNADGVPFDQVRGDSGEVLPQDHPKMQPAKYRVDIPLARPL